MSRLSGWLAVLFLAGSAFTLPLSAEEIIVTIPPDPPAQAAPSEASPSELPSFTGDSRVPAPLAQDTTSPPPETQQEAVPPPQPSQATESAPAAPAAEAAPEAPKHHTKAKKAATPDTAAGASETPAPAAAAHPATAPAKPKIKKASAAASCKSLDEAACGKNSACIWVVGTPAEGASKSSAAGCRSLAAIKKETEKAKKAAKSAEPEVLPWASQTSPSQGAAAKP